MKKRKLFDELFAEKEQKKISTILGTRQVGKTTLLKKFGEVVRSIRPEISVNPMTGQPEKSISELFSYLQKQNFCNVIFSAL